jgi:hypothetical protein
MDPVTALGVAAAVRQLVEFSGPIIGSTYTIYKAANKNNGGGSDLATITAHLVKLNAELERTATFSPSSQLDRDIATLCGHCQKAGLGLLDALAEINGASNRTLWDCFRIALKCVESRRNRCSSNSSQCISPTDIHVHTCRAQVRECNIPERDEH